MLVILLPVHREFATLQRQKLHFRALDFSFIENEEHEAIHEALGLKTPSFCASTRVCGPANCLFSSITLRKKGQGCYGEVILRPARDKPTRGPGWATLQ